MRKRKIFIMTNNYYNFEHSTKTKVVGSAPWETMEINSYICRNDAEVLGNIFKELGVQ